MKIFIALLIMISTLFAQSFKEKTSFEADFEQTVLNSSNSRIVYQGKLFIKEPSFILWKYNTPIQKDVYIRDDFVTIIEPELEQAIVSNLEKELNILNILKDAKKVTDNEYEAKLYDTDYLLQIKNDELEKISYKDELDNNITITFKNIRSNHHISNDIFKVTVPDDFDIIRK